MAAPEPLLLTRDLLTGSCSDEAYDAGLTIRTALQPLAGPGGPVKPATYAGGVYQLESRWRRDLEEDAPVAAVVIDNAPSQANRLEAALESHAESLGLPTIVLDVARVVHALPAHLPARLSSWRGPHRQADAYLRDAEPHPDPLPGATPGLP
jgi:hypothetical protein